MILKFWQWGAMHSPHFDRFLITLNHFPIEIRIDWSKWTRVFTISLSFYIPEIIVNAPHAAEWAFINAMKKQGIEIDLTDIDSIPF
ncbi:MAG: hypothetical protein KME23_17695 [Goleter apudmare HA4340-LM2]|jgi:hypothetical protein|nr:hypothetical protein [Goleter apudmare HA4340-LM2]MBW4644795.1 hypothetical protein [Goleter apudmare HA4340-LM2]